MSASYPSAVKSFTPLTDGVDYPQATHHQQSYDEITAIEDALLNGFAHHIVPDASATYDLGTSSLKWRDLFLSRNAAIGGTVTIGGITYTFPASQSASKYLQTDGAGALSWASAPTGQIALVAEINGTTTNASAENITIKAFSAADLTVKDKLLVVGTWEAVTQQTASLYLYNGTDSKNITELDQGAAIAAGTTLVFTDVICPAQSSASLWTARGSHISVTADDTRTTGSAVGYRNTMSTAWTGAWTLDLRQGGVTSGGTGKYELAVFRLVGQ